VHKCGTIADLRYNNRYLIRSGKDALLEGNVREHNAGLQAHGIVMLCCLPGSSCIPAKNLPGTSGRPLVHTTSSRFGKHKSQ